MSNKSRRNNPPRQQSARPPSAGDRRPGGTAPQGQPQRTGFRPSLERASAPWLLMLHRSPRWLVPVLLAVFLFFGLLASGPWAWAGAILLGIVTLFVAWLSALAWPVLTPGSRLARVLVTGALAGVTVLKAMGRM